MKFLFQGESVYNVFSTDGTSALIIFAQQMAQVLLAGAESLSVPAKPSQPRAPVPSVEQKL